jgi:hypothetical protein
MLILPLTGLRISDYEFYYYDAYLGNDKFESLNNKNVIFLKLSINLPFESSNTLKEMINYVTDYSYIGNDGKEYQIYVMRILDKYIDSFRMILLGNYSGLSDEVKMLIQSSFSPSTSNNIYRMYLAKVLYPTQSEFEYIFETLISNIDHVSTNWRKYRTLLKQALLEGRQVESKINLTKEWLKSYSDINKQFINKDNNFNDVCTATQN